MDRTYANFYKSMFDRVFSFVFMLLVSPILIVAAISIAVTNGRPVLFKQNRVGQFGVIFSIYKFRTMENTDTKAESDFNAGDRSRITKVGRILRRTKIDELPQLFNILLGDMSLVGPRPEIPKWISVYPNRWARVLQVKPGLSDEASLVYRNEEQILSTANDPEAIYRKTILPSKLDMYESYVGQISFITDISLIFRTIWHVIVR